MLLPRTGCTPNKTRTYVVLEANVLRAAGQLAVRVSRDVRRLGSNIKWPTVRMAGEFSSAPPSGCKPFEVWSPGFSRWTIESGRWLQILQDFAKAVNPT